MSGLHERHHHRDCFRYTALGNSVAFGVGSSFTVNDAKKHGYGYVYYFRDFLKTIFPCVKLINLAESGFNSSDLLHLLQTDTDARKVVKKADLITISIGGGDLLDCFYPSPSPDPVACLQNAVANFARNWPLILKEIRKSIRSHAEILVMNVYNPFRGDEAPFFAIAEKAIQGINKVIKANRFKFDYTVVDVHKDFLGQFTKTTQWKVCIWTHFCEIPVLLNPPDPHPTDAGHLEIARLHELSFLKSHPDKLRHDKVDDERSG